GYALQRLWHIAANGTPYTGPACIRIQAIDRGAYEAWGTCAITRVATESVMPPGQRAGFTGDELPVFTGGHAELVTRAPDGSVIFHVDVAAFAFFMLARI